ncbi:hypothetical protein CI109_107398 [Kwoniella shandongensis]|uniref:Uncharacterized protein n=1 Tax=Kwoniella shandongensis TaxID=1734106 RepID=A0A5M6BVK8_9TREE|nr:uncharacterized protein CI109_004674 [Kwoniella shandongensis]KAA5526898.1 hypothetical protein CI109_004674 [Kwoniella shandongensis]
MSSRNSELRFLLEEAIAAEDWQAVTDLSGQLAAAQNANQNGRSIKPRSSSSGRSTRSTRPRTVSRPPSRRSWSEDSPSPTGTVYEVSDDSDDEEEDYPPPPPPPRRRRQRRRRRSYSYDSYGSNDGFGAFAGGLFGGLLGGAISNAFAPTETYVVPGRRLTAVSYPSVIPATRTTTYTLNPGDMLYL